MDVDSIGQRIRQRMCAEWMAGQPGNAMDEGSAAPDLSAKDADLKWWDYTTFGAVTISTPGYDDLRLISSVP